MGCLVEGMSIRAKTHPQRPTPDRTPTRPAFRHANIGHIPGEHQASVAGREAPRPSLVCPAGAVLRAMHTCQAEEVGDTPDASGLLAGHLRSIVADISTRYIRSAYRRIP